MPGSGVRVRGWAHRSQRRRAMPDQRGFADAGTGTSHGFDAILSNGQYTGQATDAYDTAAIVHLTDYKK